MPRTKPKPPKPPPSPNVLQNRIGETSEVLTLEEAASYLRVSTDAVVRMIEAEELPARRFGADWRFDKRALQAWLGSARPKSDILPHIGRIEDDPHAGERLRDIYARRPQPESEKK